VPRALPGVEARAGWTAASRGVASPGAAWPPRARGAVSPRPPMAWRPAGANPEAERGDAPVGRTAREVPVGGRAVCGRPGAAEVPIDSAEVRHVAALARLQVTEAELPQLAAEMGRILEHVARLQQLDTTGVPPTSSALAVAGVFRDDTPAPSLPQQEALRNAPAAHGGMFLVPKVVDDGA
jgi:aspartyl-tRNA(Asn)/glutamyl-tRNA(Gln) amidotransferase subunit C